MEPTRQEYACSPVRAFVCLRPRRTLPEGGLTGASGLQAPKSRGPFAGSGEALGGAGFVVVLPSKAVESAAIN